MSSGSPVSSPSIRVSEWQVAMVAMKGDSTGKTAGSRTGSTQNFESWDGNTLHRSSPSSVKVPVYINNNNYFFKNYLTSQIQRHNTYHNTAFLNLKETNTFDNTDTTKPLVIKFSKLILLAKQRFRTFCKS
jgi:hypothetical protein